MLDALTLAQVTGCDVKLVKNGSDLIKYLSIDTRKIHHPSSTLFIALEGSLTNGHNFIQNAIDQGVRNLLLSQELDDLPSDTNVFKVENTLRALQEIAAFHRSKFPNLEVVGITGSNGKTIIKEWLSQLIFDKKIVKSPASYNSQTGVPLSVWQISEEDELAIFEAGISKIGEMEYLQKIIQPTFGIFTNIGDAHNAGFDSEEEKLLEKLKLFSSSKTILYCSDHKEIHKHINHLYGDRTLISWGFDDDATLVKIESVETLDHKTKISYKYSDSAYTITLPFTDRASLENSMHCIAFLLFHGYEIEDISKQTSYLEQIPMRLELKQGVKNSILINDTYNADLQSFKIALEFLSQQSLGRERMVILSEFHQLGLTNDMMIREISLLIHKHKVDFLITIGDALKPLERYLDPFIIFKNYQNVELLLQNLHKLPTEDKAILIKGARAYALDRIFQLLSDKGHTAVLETDLSAIEYNLTFFTNLLKKDVKIMAVIKASAYGSGSEELAKFLEYRKVAYLAVAFIDEGIALRNAGVTLPILILNPDRNGVMEMVSNQLEPEVYALDQLKEIAQTADIHLGIKFNIHIKFDTGMHRMGFFESDIDQMASILLQSKNIHVVSVFSHLSSSEDPKDDVFTFEQIAVFDRCYQKLSQLINQKPMRHILNSAGISRFNEHQFEMVRLGLGLYGIDTTHKIHDRLQKVHTLRATVMLIKSLKKGETVGYNRKSELVQDTNVAIVNIGYADGLMRKAGYGRYHVKIKGKLYPTIGAICMDVCLVDVGNASDVQPGDEVIIFGQDLPIEKLAKVCDTIPYEILTRISERIKRVFIH